MIKLMNAGKLARLGFADADAAERRLEEIGMSGDPPEVVLDALSRAVDPDRALAGLAGMLGVLPEASRAELFEADPVVLRRLTAVLGASAGLAEHLARHPEQWRELTEPNLDATRDVTVELLTAVGADPQAIEPIAPSGDGDAVDALRVSYRRALLRLAARDLEGGYGLEDVAAELADLAGAALEAALAIARARIPERSTPGRTRLAVIGMGKTGGRELNYVSDVDVLFVVDSDEGLREATQLASSVIKICSEHTAEGTLWPVDAALRPEGKNGQLVRTLPSYLAYYRRWAKTWEFQALLKARPIAGDRGLGAEFVAAVSPLVWSVGDREGFVEDVQAMRRRVVAHIPAKQMDRELKLGPGGLRDVEFAVQLLQLVHGRTDDTLRSPSTLLALDALIAGGYVGREDGAALADAYRFLRTLEHRIQLTRLRRTHLMPTDERELWALGRSLGFVSEPVAELTDSWKRHSREVRRLHEKLFYRPLLAAVARIPGDEVRLSPEAARQRLAALGYLEPAAALRHLEALTAGVSRRAAIQRTLLPVMLEWFADAPDPDAGLLAFRQVSDDLGSTPWYLRLLRDEGVTAQRLAVLLGSSRFVVDLIRRAPETIAMLGSDDELEPRTRAALEPEMLAAAGRYQDDRSQAIGAVRAVRRRELFRIAAADILGQIPVDTVVSALSELAASTITAGLLVADGVAGADSDRTREGSALATPLISRTKKAIIGMGRLGGFEISYGSDADVMFVHSGDREAALAVVSELRRLLALSAADPPLNIDVTLRPEGKNGPLTRTLDSYASYYAKWSEPWEAQALLRAAPLAGSSELLTGFVELADRYRYPADGLSDADVREIRRIKARVDAERLPRGADPTTHTKLGRGGLADVEWTVQLLQLRHACAIPALRTTRTIEALEAAQSAELIAPADANALAQAWRFATRARNAIMLVSGRAADSLPRNARELSSVARVLGYEAHSAGEFLEDYRRITRRAHSVVERVFWS